MIYAVGIPDGNDWLLVSVDDAIVAFDTEDEAVEFAAQQGDEYMPVPYEPAPGEDYVVVT